jgi:hypothetical protein
MPETAVDLHNDMSPREDQVWATWEPSHLRAKPIAQAMEESAYEQLGTRAASLIATHQSRNSGA